jgi:hypothetical protein
LGLAISAETAHVGGTDEEHTRDEVSASLVTLRLPIPWASFGLPNDFQTRTTCLVAGDEPGWAWDPAPPPFEVPDVDAVSGEAVAGWDLDHVVLLVPDLAGAIATLAEADLSPRLELEVKGRPTAFFRVGPVLEVIESPVRAASLFGVALITDEPLEVVVLRWRSRGHQVTDPRPAIQPGRQIFTVRGVDAGLAVMSPEAAVAG